MSESTLPASEPRWGGGNGIAATAKYNPHLWSADELRAIFVVRQQELARILAAVRAVPAGGVPQHMLITGQRGMGKSTLLQRVALAVNDDAAAGPSWLALRFPEEQYTVSTPAELWSNVIGALADTLERQGLPIEAIDQKLLQLGKMLVAQREEAALDWLQQWCMQQQKRLLLLIDSTDLLFSNLAGAAAGKRSAGQDGGATPLWRVRKVLQHSPHFFWLGGSYQPLEVNGLYSDAFLDFFQLIELRPLTLLEMQTAILALAYTFGAGLGLRGDAAETEVRRMLDARPERLRAMRQLTGGNPRTTIILYELFTSGGQESVRSDLERLLDAMTPLYKARLEVLADQPRKVLAHVMESWAPITAKGLADVSGISVSAVSTQLTRLEQEGLVEKAQMSGTRKQGYQASERFFNIWYLMRSAARNARARVGWLVEFMRLWYSNNELQDLAKIRWREHRDGMHCDFAELEYSRAVARAMPKSMQERQHLDWAVFRHARNSSALKDLFDLQGEDSEYSTPDDYLARLDKVRIGLRDVQLEEPEKSKWVNEVIGALWMPLREKEVLAKECKEMQIKSILQTRANIAKARKWFNDTYDNASIDALESAVISGDFFPDCPDSKLALTQIETCFGLLPNAFATCVWQLSGLQNDANVELACKKAIELAPTSARPWHLLGTFLHRNKQYDEAEAAYRKAIELDTTCASSWGDLGSLLHGKLNRYDEAEVAYRKAIEINVVWLAPWWYLGRLLQYNMNRFDEAEAAYRKAIEIDQQRAEPWADLGNLLLYELERYDEAEGAYRKAIEIDAKYPTSWAGLGDLLQYQLNRFDEAEAAYRKAIEIDAKYPPPWVGLGDLLQYQLNRFDEAETAYRMAIALDPTWAYPLECLSDLLCDHSKKYEEAVTILQQLITLEPDSDDHWHSLGELLQNKLSRFDEAEVAYRNAIRDDAANAYAPANLGRLFAVTKRNNEATEQYRMTLEIASETDHNLRLQAHCWLGNNDLALQSLDALAEQASKNEDDAFFRLKEQCYEIHAIGLGNVLLDLMARSHHAEFLQPFALALRAASGDRDCLLDVAVEVRGLAEEILLEITDGSV